MGDWQADVFVEMKSLHFGPVDARCLGQSIQKFELRRGCRSDDPHMVTLCDGTTNGRRCLLGCRVPERDPIIEYFEQHKECFIALSRIVPLRASKIIQKRRLNRRSPEPEFHYVKANADLEYNHRPTHS